MTSWRPSAAVKPPWQNRKYRSASQLAYWLIVKVRNGLGAGKPGNASKPGKEARWRLSGRAAEGQAGRVQEGPETRGLNTVSLLGTVFVVAHGAGIEQRQPQSRSSNELHEEATGIGFVL